VTPNISLALLRTQTDARLAGLAAAGHDRAFEAIVERYRRPLMQYARSFKLEDGAAEDVVQASCVAAWAALRDGALVHDLRPWLYRIVHNRAINALRAVRGVSVPLHEAPDQRPGPQADVESREEVRQALDGIAALPDRQRAALVAVAIDGRAHADVGEQLGVSDMAVRKLVSRARGSLRAAATAITPMPVAGWLAHATGPSSDHAARISELVAAGGSAGLAGGSMLKAGAIAVTVCAVAAGTPQIADHGRESARPEAAQASEPRRTSLAVRFDAGADSQQSTAAVDDQHARARDNSGPGSRDESRDRDDEGSDPSADDHEDRSGPSGDGDVEPDGSKHSQDDDPERPQSDESASEPSGSDDVPSASGSSDSGPSGSYDPPSDAPRDSGTGSPEPEPLEPSLNSSGSLSSDSSRAPDSGLPDDPAPDAPLVRCPVIAFHALRGLPS